MSTPGSGDWTGQAVIQPTQPRRHSTAPRGTNVVSSNLPTSGQFGRMFQDSPDPKHTEDDLRFLAATMISPPEPSKDLGVPDANENVHIPAGYTYLGQFLDHDITFDPASSLQRRNDPAALVDYRTPRFDLDSVYGRGPADDPFLYLPGDTVEVAGGQLQIGPGLKFLLEPVEGVANPSAAQVDLPRNRLQATDGGWIP